MHKSRISRQRICFLPELVEHLCEEISARKGVGMLRPEIGTGGLLLGDVFDDVQCVGRAAEAVGHPARRYRLAWATSSMVCSNRNFSILAP